MLSKGKIRCSRFWFVAGSCAASALSRFICSVGSVYLRFEPYLRTQTSMLDTEVTEVTTTNVGESISDNLTSICATSQVTVTGQSIENKTNQHMCTKISRAPETVTNETILPEAKGDTENQKCVFMCLHELSSLFRSQTQCLHNCREIGLESKVGSGTSTLGCPFLLFACFSERPYLQVFPFFPSFHLWVQVHRQNPRTVASPNRMFRSGALEG